MNSAYNTLLTVYAFYPLRFFGGVDRVTTRVLVVLVVPVVVWFHHVYIHTPRSRAGRD